MAEGNSIKDEVKEQRKKFLTLTFTGKLQYIWEYYRIPIAAVIAVVLVVLSFINATEEIIMRHYVILQYVMARLQDTIQMMMY